MKKLLTYLLVFSCFFTANAQTPCATTMPADMMNWLKEYKTSGRAPSYKQGGGMEYIPLQLHIVGTSAGGGYFKISQMLDALCILNEQYSVIAWQFYIKGIDYIDSDSLNVHDDNTRYERQLNNLSIENVVNIFFVDNPAGACGYYASYLGPGTGWQNRQGIIAINESCAGASNTTIAHELGHFFSLPHTFYGWEGRDINDAPTANDERADGSNCGFSGDYFCDTRADWQSDRWMCPYTKTKTDFAGVKYQPDSSLYMGYSYDACATRFSSEQVDAMKSYLADERPYLLTDSPDSFAVVSDTSKALFPLSNAIGVPSNYAQLKWIAVGGATHYSLQVTSSANGTVMQVDTIVTDTSIILTNLANNKLYRWRVRAFNMGSFCSPYTAYRTFKTDVPTSINPTFTISNVTCPGENNGTVQANVTGGTGPYAYAWSDGSTSDYVFDLPPGSYQVTVSDVTNDSVVLSVDIHEPDTLSLDITVAGNLLVPAVAGGTPVYIYSWSNGSSDVSVPLAAVGNYTLTVEDSKGCVAVKAFSYTSVDDLTGINELSIYPNPASKGQALTIEVQSISNFNGLIEVYDNTGRMVRSYNRDIVNGRNRYNLNLDNLQSGVYIVKVSGKDLAVNKKVVIY